METITFYSYKGGVGRSLALSNTASYLSKFGLSVCVLDFDLEAPGLHYKFGFSSDNIKKGLVDLIYEYQTIQNIPSLNSFIIDLPKLGDGAITLFPAGAVKTPQYWQRLSEINWSYLLYSEQKMGVIFFLELKERIEKEINPDFLLIDSRTGITEIGGICTSLLPDKVTFLFTNNEENIEGVSQVLRSIKRAERLPGQAPIETFFALTRIPYTKSSDLQSENYIVQKVQTQLNLIVENEEVNEIIVIHSDRDLELSESLAVNQLDKSQESLLLNDYLRLFSNIISEEVIVPKLDFIISNILTNTLEDPEIAQAELESIAKSYQHPKAYESLLSFYILRNITDERFVKMFHKIYNISTVVKPKIFHKYIEGFLNEKRSSWEKKTIFNLNIIEDYIYGNKNFEVNIALKLAKTYFDFDQYSNAIKIYNFILTLPKVYNEALLYLIQSLIKLKKYKELEDVFDSYQDIIENDMNLKVQYIKCIIQVGNNEELKRLLNKDPEETENYLIENYLDVAIEVFQRIDRVEILNQKAEKKLSSALISGNYRTLIEIGSFYQQIGKFDNFKSRISSTPEGEEVIRELERRQRRFF